MTLRLDDFAGSVGERFDILAGEETVSVVLEVAQPLPRSMREEGAFRLEWRGPKEPLLPQAIYAFRRDGREFEMFIVPVASNDRGTLYEAIFN